MHGKDGLDEVSISGPTEVAVLENGVKVSDGAKSRRKTPGLKRLLASRWRTSPAAMRRTTPPPCAGCWKAARSGAYRDVVLLNAAAALMVADQVEEYKPARTRVLRDGGMRPWIMAAARAKLEDLITASNA